MSNLNIALKHKATRANEVVSVIMAFAENIEDTLDNKKYRSDINRISKQLKKKTDSCKNDFDYLFNFFESTKKIILKIEEHEQDSTLLVRKMEWVNDIKPIVIFDVDDTLRDASHRMWVRKEIEDLKEKVKLTEDPEEKAEIRKEIDAKWQVFFIEGFKDKPKQEMINLCNLYYDLGFEVRIRTGASALYYDETVKHLKEMGVKYHDLRMRKINVKIPDYRLKPAWISKYDLAENVFATYDDRQPLNDNYQKKGVIDTFLVDKEFDPILHFSEMRIDIEHQVEFFR